MSREWFERHHAAKTLPEFESWWLAFYGPPEAYEDQDEYWTRKGFALTGWRAARGLEP